MISSHASLLSRIQDTIQRHALFVPGDTVVLALSGGADSSALLDILLKLPDYCLTITVVHLNHCLRGTESDGDEEFCRTQAARYGLPFVCRSCDVTSLAAERKLTLEDAGRQARIAFFDEVSAKQAGATVVLAHHADDQAETFLMRMLRGAGMTGLSGMEYRNGRGYVRPLLDITRCEIEQYLRHNGLAWREDASNSDTAFLRNRIRHELLPCLRTYNPAISSTLADTAAILRGDEQLLEDMTAQLCAEISHKGEGGEIICSVEQLRSFDSARRSRVFRYQFKQLTGSLQGLSRAHLFCLEHIIDTVIPNTRLKLPAGVLCVREYDRLILTHGSDEVPPENHEVVIREKGCHLLPDGTVLEVGGEATATSVSTGYSVVVSATQVPFPWVLRLFRPGDRMQPLGMSGTKKIKNIFIDKKVPAAVRAKTPLLLCGNEIFWAVGICLSERCRSTEHEGEVISVRWVV